MALFGTAEMILRNGTTAFAVTTNKSDVASCIADLKAKIDHEFDHSFEADEWHKVTIVIERK